MNARPSAMTPDDFFARLPEYEPRHAPVWDALWSGRSIGRIAVGVAPDAETVKRAREATAGLDWPEPAEKPLAWKPAWRDAVLEGVAGLAAGLDMPGDACPALTPPRFVHSQTQGICDIFGARIEEQPDWNIYVYPLPADPAFIGAVTPLPIERSRYWGAVEWVRYARAMTGGLFEFRNPVMTGPFDTANYLLGTSTLMEWVHTEPETLRRFLDKITDVIIGMVRAIQQAAGGRIYAPHHAGCVRGGFDFCSECRSLVSRDIYEAFEAPALRRIGEALGQYAIHACGSWERTVPSALADPNLRLMNGQIRENDLAQLCALARGRIALSIGPSVNVHERYTWSSREDFFAHVLRTVPRAQPFEIGIGAGEVDLWNRLCNELDVGYNRVAPVENF